MNQKDSDKKMYKTLKDYVVHTFILIILYYMYIKLPIVIDSHIFDTMFKYAFVSCVYYGIMLNVVPMKYNKVETLRHGGGNKITIHAIIIMTIFILLSYYFKTYLVFRIISKIYALYAMCIYTLAFTSYVPLFYLEREK